MHNTTRKVTWSNVMKQKLSKIKAPDGDVNVELLQNNVALVQLQNS